MTEAMSKFNFKVFRVLLMTTNNKKGEKITEASASVCLLLATVQIIIPFNTFFLFPPTPPPANFLSTLLLCSLSSFVDSLLSYFLPCFLVSVPPPLLVCFTSDDFFS